MAELQPQYKNVVKAIHNVQQEIEIVGKKEKADMGAYKYSYASMSNIWLELRPLLKKHDLTIIQSPTTGDGVSGDYLRTTVYHNESGESISELSRLIITRDDPQGYGSAITYARRYALVSMLGIVTDDDNDATTQRLADGEMKREWVSTFKVMMNQTQPDHVVTNQDFMNFMEQTYGKHPSRVLAKEHQQVLDIIKAFGK